MADWKDGKTAPTDGSEFLACWKGDSGPRLLRRVWSDGEFTYSRPDYWMPIVVPTTIRPAPDKK